MKPTNESENSPEELPFQTAPKDAVMELLKQLGGPITRERYLKLAYMGEVPEKLSVEEELALPEEFRNLDDFDE